MNIQKLIESMDEEFDKEYGWYLQGLIDGEGGNYKDRIKSFYHSKIKKLVQAVGKEVIGKDEIETLEYAGKKHTSHDATSRIEENLPMQDNYDYRLIQITPDENDGIVSIESLLVIENIIIDKINELIKAVNELEKEV